MPAQFELDPERRLVHSRAWGALTDADLVGHASAITALFRRGALDATWAQIYDFSGVESIEEVSAACVRRLAESGPWPADSVRVMIVPSEVTFGLARMYQLSGAARTDRVHVTRDRVGAMAFIAHARAAS